MSGVLPARDDRYRIGLRPGVLAPPFGVVLIGTERVGPETSAHGRRVVVHDVEVLADPEQEASVPEAAAWVRRLVREVMPAGPVGSGRGRARVVGAG